MKLTWEWITGRIHHQPLILPDEIWMTAIFQMNFPGVLFHILETEVYHPKVYDDIQSHCNVIEQRLASYLGWARLSGV